MPKYSNEFKSKAVRRYCEDPDATYKQVAAEFEINPTTLRRWVRESRQEFSQAYGSVPRNDFKDSSVRNLLQANTIERVYLAAPSDEAPEIWPIRIGALPLLAADRQDRSVDEELASVLDGGGTAVVCQLSGMGGVGKTQVATAYAHQQWKQGELDLLVWVSATTRDNIVAAFAEAAITVCGATRGDSEQNASTFISWLARSDGPRWLVVLDDVASPADLADLWPPSSPAGRTIVTTRCRDAALDGVGRHRIDVDLFTESEAAHYLNDRLRGDADRLVGAAALAAALGYLPLALAQAVAYILDQPGLGCEDYRKLFVDRAIRLAELSPDSLPDGHQRTVAATWSLSIERADSHSPKGAATAILRLACLLDPNAIPVEIFTCRSAQRFLSTEVGPDEGKRVEPRTTERTLGRMHLLSLIDFDGWQVRVHALVQRAVFDDIEAQRCLVTARAAADSLDEIWPSPDNQLAASALLRSNIEYLQRSAEAALFATRIHPVLFRMGYSLAGHGQVSAASSHFQHLYEISRQRLGEDHLETFEVCFALAVSLGSAGDAAGAVEALGNVLDGRMRVLGPDHPGTRAAREGIALWENAAHALEASRGLRNTYIG